MWPTPPVRLPIVMRLVVRFSKGFLQPVGFSVLEASDIKSLIDIIHTQNIDCIIADIGLFNTDNSEECELQSVTIAKEILIMVISANTLTENREAALRMGVIPKPFYEKQLFDGISRVVNITYITEREMDYDENVYNEGDNHIQGIIQWLMTLEYDKSVQIKYAIEVQDFELLLVVLNKLSEIERKKTVVIRLKEICNTMASKELIELSRSFI